MLNIPLLIFFKFFLANVAEGRLCSTVCCGAKSTQFQLKFGQLEIKNDKSYLQM